MGNDEEDRGGCVDVEAVLRQTTKMEVERVLWRIHVWSGESNYGSKKSNLGNDCVTQDDVNARRRKPCREARDTMRHLVSQNVT